MSARVYGLDPSLSSTGVACVELSETDPSGVAWMWTDHIAGPGHGCQRIDDIVRRTKVMLSVGGVGDRLTLVVVEAPIYRTPKLRTAAGTAEPSLRGYHERAGLWWALACMLKRAQIPFATCPPANLKKWATDNGNERKERVMLRVAAEFPQAEIGSNDEADAFVCAMMGAHWLTGASFAAGYQYRTRALNGVEWPVSAAALGWVSPAVADQLTALSVAS